MGAQSSELANEEVAMSQPNQKMKTVFTVVQREGKSHWVKMGIGFVNADGSINLKLDGYPTNSTLQIRDYESPEEREQRFGRERPLGDADRTGAFSGLS